MIVTDTIDGVRVLRMDAEQNQFAGPFVEDLTAALDEAADSGGPLVLTGTGRTFSLGLDLDWLGAVPESEAMQLLRDVHAVLARLLRFPGATVAAVNGHAFGAGFLLAAAADFRVQRADRGYLCLPEVDLGLAMTDEFDAVLRAKLPPAAVLEALVTGRRYGGPDALAAGFVDAVAAEEDLVEAAVARVRDLVDKVPAHVAAIKEKQHAAALAVLDAGS